MKRKQVSDLVCNQLQQWLEVTNFGTNVIDEKERRLSTIIAMMGHSVSRTTHPVAIGDTSKTKEFKKEIDKIFENVVASMGIESLNIDSQTKILHDSDHGIFAFYRPHFTTTNIKITIEGNVDIIDDILDNVVSRLPKLNFHPITDWVASSREDVAARKTTIPKNDPDLFNAFYPFLDKTPKQWWDDFQTSNSNIALLIGAPGTGKSNFIKSCIDSFEPDDSEKLNICSDENALLIPGFPMVVRDRPDGSLFIIEDADRLIAAREDGNTSMASLLNTLSGVLSSSSKIIVTTNTPSVHMVDEALRRPGRTHSILEFGKLTANQANAARRSIGKVPIDFNSDGNYTLAQALNWDVGNASQASVKGPGFM